MRFRVDGNFAILVSAHGSSISQHQFDSLRVLDGKFALSFGWFLR